MQRHLRQACRFELLVPLHAPTTLTVHGYPPGIIALFSLALCTAVKYDCNQVSKRVRVKLKSRMGNR